MEGKDEGGVGDHRVFSFELQLLDFGLEELVEQGGQDRTGHVLLKGCLITGCLLYLYGLWFKYTIRYL